MGNCSSWGNHDRRNVLAGDLRDGVPRPKQSGLKLRYLTKRQAGQCWHTIHRHAPRLERYFLLALWTGARRTELAAIQWQDVFTGPDDGRLYVRIENFKTQSERAVPVAPRLLRHLVRWGYGTHKTGPIVGQVFAPDTLGHMLCDVITEHGQAMPVFGELAAKATGNGWHVLRHTFASWASMAGVDMRVIKEWLDHRCITTTMRYLAVKPTTSAHLIERL